MTRAAVVTLLIVTLPALVEPGRAAEPADFNGDSCGDLAIGVPDEDVIAKNTGVLQVNAGAVHVLNGSYTGLGATEADELLLVDFGDMESGDRFGEALAAGDFNGDGFSDLAVGFSAESVGTAISVGAVRVFHGAAVGLAPTAAWTQDSPGVIGVAEDDDRFGASLAAGDFNGDGYDDLAVSVVNESVDGLAEAGGVNVLYGGPSGLSAAGNQFWSQNSPGILGGAEANDHFGMALAAGDFNGDGADDLVIGVPHETLEGSEGADLVHAGAVHVIYGDVGGGLAAAPLYGTRNMLWTQDSPWIQGMAESEDYFGSSLAVGDFDESGADDLAVGVPFEDLPGIPDAGAVNVLYGYELVGLRTTNNQLWHQDVGDVAGTAEADDRFGLSLASGDFDGDHEDELAIGVPFDGPGDNGGVHVLRGSGYAAPGELPGLTDEDNQYWTGAPSVPGEHFGAHLASGQFDCLSAEDLAVGVPRRATSFIAEAGAVRVLFGDIDGLSAFGAVYLHQDSPFVDEAPEGNDHFGRSVAGR